MPLTDAQRAMLDVAHGQSHKATDLGKAQIELEESRLRSRVLHAAKFIEIVALPTFGDVKKAGKSWFARVMAYSPSDGMPVLHDLFVPLSVGIPVNGDRSKLPCGHGILVPKWWIKAKMDEAEKDPYAPPGFVFMEADLISPAAQALRRRELTRIESRMRAKGPDRAVEYGPGQLPGMTPDEFMDNFRSGRI